MRATVLLLAVLMASTSGCIANMGDLKAALGVIEPASLPVPEPTLLPPFAKAQANLTSVAVGATVRFTSEGTRDPQGLRLDHVWSFGDGATAPGATALHAYAKPGEYDVRLTVTNADGLTDVASLTLHVLPAGRAPTACFDVVDERGQPPATREAGVTLVLDASCSQDPDGDALTYEWDLGEGAAVPATGMKAPHSYALPGLYVVKLKVTDATGRAGELAKSLPIDYRGERKGTFDLTGPTTNAHAFPMAKGARSLELTLTYPGGLGGNDLLLVVKDAKGDEVERLQGATPLGAQEDQVRTLTLDAADLAPRATGEWTVEVVKAKGLTLDYTVKIVETF